MSILTTSGSEVWSAIRRWHGWPVVLLVTMNLVLGALLVRDYGMSTDESKIYKYAAHSLENYSRVIHGLAPVDFSNGNLDYYGPAFFMAAGLFARLMRFLSITGSGSIAWHFFYLASFQVAILSIYFLCRRWMGTWAAFGGSLLFATQPVFWGHAFINPKDIPFMAFFLASVACGFAMVDGISRSTAFPEFGRIGSAQLPDLDDCVIRPFARQMLKGSASPVVLLAGLVLGITTSIRVLGPFAGMIVVLYALYVCPRRAPGVLVPYLAVAGLTSFLTWPFLWTSPLIHFYQSIRVMSEFPWQGSVLFEGKSILATELPARYLPKMLALQLTESALILFLGGFALAVVKMFRERILAPFFVVIIWFLMPIMAIILAGSTLYDGFRQVFFLIPPVFICAGLALDWVFARLKPIPLRVLALGLMAAGGVYSIITLHPYEYIYYNGLVGGVRGAFRNYELDYWATSYREAADYVNAVAPANARVIVYGPDNVYVPYSRPDVKVVSRDEAKTLAAQQNMTFDYAVVLDRNSQDLRACRSGQALKTIERDGAILAVVKRIMPGKGNCP